MDKKHHYVIIKRFNSPEDITMIKGLILRQIKLKLENIRKEWMNQHPQ